MAELVLGVGSSHGPMLNTPPERWGDRAEADRRNTNLIFEGREYDFETLLAERGGPEAFADRLGEEVWRDQHARCQRALDELHRRIADVAPDVAIIVSSDHKEIFQDELLPSLAVYWGDSVEHVPFTEEQRAAMAPGLAIASLGDTPEVQTTRPCHSGLAKHLIASALDDGFDVAASQQLPAGRHDNHGIPHGWGFIYRQVMKDDVIPNVPVFVNTFYPPNQPLPSRCYSFGESLRRAVESWDQDLKVAVIASGGLSHFVIDEDLDRKVLQAMEVGDRATLSALPPEQLRSGSSEIRNWITVAGAVADADLKMDLVDYVPCYRSEAGTGNAMGFVSWS